MAVSRKHLPGLSTRTLPDTLCTANQMPQIETSTEKNGHWVRCHRPPDDTDGKRLPSRDLGSDGAVEWRPFPVDCRFRQH